MPASREKHEDKKVDHHNSKLKSLNINFLQDTYGVNKNPESELPSCVLSEFLGFQIHCH